MVTYFIPDAAGNDDIISPCGSSTDDKTIVNASARIYSTINYTTKTQDNVKYVKLTSVSGGIDSFNSGFYLVSQDVTYGCSGAPAGTQSVDKTITTKTWSYTCPTNWKYVNAVAVHFVGVSVTATIKHGTSQYSGTFSHLY